MQCKFVVDVGVNPAALDEAHKALMKFRPVNGGRTLEAYFPAGTVYSHPNAAFFCNAGSALPHDAECESVAKPVTAEQRAKQEQSYQADNLGIHDPGDRELFFAGVILGYRKDESGKLVYLPGPRWPEYQAAKSAIANEDEI